MSNSLVTPWTVAHQAPSSIEFARQEYWSGLPFPSPGDLPDVGIEHESLMSPSLAGRFFTTESPEKASLIYACKWLQSCPTLCDRVDCCLSGSSFYRILLLALFSC